LRPGNTSRRTADWIDDEAERGRRVVVDVGPPCCRSVVPGAGPVTGIAAVHGLLAGRSAVADDAATERVEIRTADCLTSVLRVRGEWPVSRRHVRQARDACRTLAPLRTLRPERPRRPGSAARAGRTLRALGPLGSRRAFE